MVKQLLLVPLGFTIDPDEVEETMKRLASYTKRFRALSRIYLWTASLESPERLSPNPIPLRMNGVFFLAGEKRARRKRGQTRWTRFNGKMGLHCCLFVSFSTIETPTSLSSRLILARSILSPLSATTAIKLDSHRCHAWVVKKISNIETRVSVRIDSCALLKLYFWNI